MKSKRLMGLLLAGAVMVGATMYGSYAWFTDEVTTDANLTIAMGNLDIEIEEPETDEQWWVKTPSESFDQDFAPTDWYSNVRPGDAFTREVTVHNVGSLAAKLDVVTADLADTVVANGVTFGEVFEFTAEGAGEVELAAGEELVLNLTLTVREDLGNALNANNGSEDLFEINIDSLLEDTKFINIQASQINAK